MRNLLFCILVALVSRSNAQFTTNAFTVSPNPFTQRTLLSYTIANADTVTIDIVNVTGKVILSPRTKEFLTAGIYNDSIILDAYPAGIYYLSLWLGNTKQVAKLVKTTPASISETRDHIKHLIWQDPDGQLLLSFPDLKTETEVTIYNMLGQEVMHKTVEPDQNESILMGKYKGIYLVVVSNARSNLRLKVLVQ